MATERPPAHTRTSLGCDRENLQAYGTRKVWKIKRAGFAVGRRTVRRLMGELALKGALRGRTTSTTFLSSAEACPAERVNRQFQTPLPNALRAGAGQRDRGVRIRTGVARRSGTLLNRARSRFDARPLCTACRASRLRIYRRIRT